MVGVLADSLPLLIVVHYKLVERLQAWEFSQPFRYLLFEQFELLTLVVVAVAILDRLPFKIVAPLLLVQPGEDGMLLFSCQIVGLESQT